MKAEKIATEIAYWISSYRNIIFFIDKITLGLQRER